MDSEKIYDWVIKSPELVARHDREGWLDLFSGTAVVQDPVGAGPNRKGRDYRGERDGLDRFYDVFIAPNDIRFQINQDIVIGNEVVRDVLITTRMSNGAVSEVWALLRYHVISEHGKPRIEGLDAHWDLTKNSINLLRMNGMKGMTASCAMFMKMIGIQGVFRVMAYCQAMYRGIRSRGVRLVARFAEAVNERDTEALTGLFDPPATIEYPAGNAIPADSLLEREGPDLRLGFTGIRSAGWFTSCVFDFSSDNNSFRGVVFFEFSQKSKKIKSARFFWNRS